MNSRKARSLSARSITRLSARTVMLACALLALGANSVATGQENDNSQTAPMLNNEGVKQLNSGHYAEAIRLFERALKLDPKYPFARENLAIACNNYSLSLPPARAVAFLKRALQLSPNNSTTQKNLQAKLAELDRAGAKPMSTDEDKAVLGADLSDPQAPPLPETLDRIRKLDSAPDMAAYLKLVERSLLKHWFPSQRRIPRQVVISFWISDTGEISNVKLQQDGSDSGLTAAELEAVRSINVKSPLPAGHKTPVPLVAVFTYRSDKTGDSTTVTVSETDAAPLKLISPWSSSKGDALAPPLQQFQFANRAD